MDQVVRLNVSHEVTAICVASATGRRLWRGQCAADSEHIERAVRMRVGEKYGPLSYARNAALKRRAR